VDEAADGGFVDATIGEDLRGHPVTFLGQGQQEVLAADVIVAEACGLVRGPLEHPLGTGCKWNRTGAVNGPGAIQRAPSERRLDPAPNFIEIDPDAGQCIRVKRPSHRSLAPPDDPDDAGAHSVRADAKLLQRMAAQAVGLCRYTQQEVLGAEVVVAETARLLLGDDEHPPGAIREPGKRTRR
jgi:hypothetical protein